MKKGENLEVLSGCLILFDSRSFGLLKPNTFTKVRSNTFVAVIAVNIEASVPKANVTAKPLIGPVPNTNNIAVIIKVVKFESNIATKPFPNPDSIEFLILFSQILILLFYSFQR